MAAAVVNPVDVVSSVLLDQQDLACELCKSCLLLQSIVMSVFNASKWLEEVLSSVAVQTFVGSLELSVFDDASTVRRKEKQGRVLGVYAEQHISASFFPLKDSSLEILRKWQPRFEGQGIKVVISSHHGCNPMGRKHRQAKREDDTTHTVFH